MSLHADEQFLAAVAAALGETIALVRRRGFHLEPAAANGDPRAADSAPPNDRPPPPIGRVTLFQKYPHRWRGVGWPYQPPTPAVFSFPVR